MSFEGYTQYLCPMGHYWTHEVHYENDNICDFCDQEAVEQNLVDLTNGVEEGYREIIEIAPAKTKMCMACEHEEEVEPARWRFKKEDKDKKVYR